MIIYVVEQKAKIHDIENIYIICKNLPSSFDEDLRLRISRFFMVEGTSTLLAAGAMFCLMPINPATKTLIIIIIIAFTQIKSS